MYHIHLIYMFFIYIITLEVQRFERLEIQAVNDLPKVIQLFSSRTRTGISGFIYRLIQCLLPYKKTNKKHLFA